jgi:hypothetical protein
MKPRKVLLMGTLLLFLVGFSGANQVSAGDISDQCKADLRALVERCANECPGNFRCFLRCVVNNFPGSCLE